jgi:glyoxylase-like metal-dependent hydrolase (beta-lactamase superfamily II)
VGEHDVIDDGERLYFRQLLAGRDYAVSDAVARQMVNFVYLIGDRHTGEALVVDPAYDVGALLDLVAADGMTLSGVLVTHYHADHIGGLLMEQIPIEGLAALLERTSVPVHVNAHEDRWVTRSTGVGSAELVSHDDGDRVQVGAIGIELLHTPGHTPGSQCFLVGDRLISGDTLFLDGCGRTDLPGSDPDAMYDSLRRLAALPGAVAVLPGHRYSNASTASMSDVRATNVALQPDTVEEWRAMFSPR